MGELVFGQAFFFNATQHFVLAFCLIKKKPIFKYLRSFKTEIFIMKTSLQIASISLLLLLCASINSRAQCLQAVSYGQTEYNVAGSGGIPFDTIPGSGHWNNYGHGCSDMFVSKRYNFSIPPGAHILGISVFCDVILHDISDSSIMLLKHGTPYGADGATHMPIIAAGTISWGDTTTLWGGAWTPADFNDSGFGVQFRMRDIRADSVFGWYDANPVYITVAYDTLVHSGVTNVSNYKSGVRVYPNPTSTTISIEFGALVQNARLVLHNMTGQVVTEKANISNPIQVLDISDLAKGIYILESTVDGVRFVHKLVLE